MNAEILLSMEDKMARSHMAIQLIDLYEVEFSCGEMTDLAVNIIAESMYAQCDVGRNDSLLLEAFINHRKNGSTLSVDDQKVVIKG